jgi:hypothetical protein
VSDDIIFQATSKAADAPDVEPGIYDARFDGVEAKLIKGGEYTKDTVNGDPKFEWTFTLFEDGAVLYDKGEPVEVNGLTSRSMNKASKTQPRALRYVRALLAANPQALALFEAESKLNAKDMIGTMCQVEVAIKDSGWPSIANVLPAKTRKRRAAAAEADEE